MAKIEIDESELRDYQGLRKVVESISKHPKGGLLLEEAHKLINPEAKTPRLDALKTVNEPVESVQKELADLRKQLAEEKAENEKNAKLAQLQARVDKGHAKLREEGWTADGLKVLDEFREKEGILDPVAAAAYYEKLNGPQVVPATPSSHYGRWDFTDVPAEGESYAKKLLETRGDSETLVMQEAMKALKEFNGGRR